MTVEDLFPAPPVVPVTDDVREHVIALMSNIANIAEHQLAEIEEEHATTIFVSALVTSLASIGVEGFGEDKEGYLNFLNTMRLQMLEYYNKAM